MDSKLVRSGRNEPALLVFQSTAVATVKAEVPKAELAKDSKLAPVAAATAASVLEKKGEAKTSHTKVEPPPSAGGRKTSCVPPVHSGRVSWRLC